MTQSQINLQKVGGADASAFLAEHADSPFTDATMRAAEQEAGLAITGLARKRGDLAQQAATQLRELFPGSGGNAGYYGQGLRLTSGSGSVALMLAKLRHV